MFIKEKYKKLNISFDTDNENNIQLWKDIYGVHAKIGNEILGDYPEITKITDYFYEITIDKIDDEYSYGKMPNPYIINGACSEFKVNNIIGRSYDWNYNNNCEFLVRTKGIEGRYDSIGISAVRIPESEMKSKKYNELLKFIPYQMLDGVNEKGVYCGMNVVPHGDKGKTTGTNSNGKDLPSMFIPRIVLDKADTARKAIDLIKSRNVFAIEYYDEVIELHIMIADKNSTYIVEFIDNKVYVMSDQDDEFDNIPNDKAIMTNFYLHNWNGEIKAGYTGDTKEEIDATGLTPHAQGLERYTILSEDLDSVTDLEKALALINKVIYTKAYKTSTSPFWYSEFTQVRPNVDLYTSEEGFQDLKQSAIQYYENRSRDTGYTWQSVHQDVYDIENKTLKVSVQEGTNVYSYSLTE